MRKCLALLLPIVFCVSAHAATLKLKSGLIVEGEIYERTEDFVRINTDIGVPVLYFFEEIESIEEDEDEVEAMLNKKLDIKPKEKDDASRPKDISETKIPHLTVYDVIPELNETKPELHQTTDHKQAEDYYDLGVIAAEVGDYPKAKLNFLKAIDEDSQFVDAYYNLGLVSGLMEKYGDAISFFKRAIKLDPEGADSYYGLGVAYNSTGQLDLAKKSLERAVELRSTFTEAYYKLSVIYSAEANYELAKRMLNKAITINPEYMRAYYQLGLIGGALGDNLAATRNFKKAIELDPNFPDTYYNLGVVYATNGQFDKAIHQFQKSVDLGSENPDTFYNLGMAHLGLAKNSVTIGSLGAYQKAKENLQKARDLYSTETDYATIQRIDQILTEIP